MRSASALALCLALPAAAQPPAAPPEAPAACVARDLVTAEINAREGIRLAQEGDFAAAEALFLMSTRLDPCKPAYPFLLGRALERQGKLDDAEAAYTVVVERFPTSVEFTKAQGALAVMRAERAKAEAARREEEARAAAVAAAAAAAAAQTDKPDPGPAPPGPAASTGAATGAGVGASTGDLGGRTTVSAAPWRAVGLLTGGLGVVALGAGVGFSLAAQDADDELALAATRPDRDRYDALVDERETFSTLGWVGYGAGAALLLGGLAMVLVADDAEAAPTLTPAPGGAAVGVSGRF